MNGKRKVWIAVAILAAMMTVLPVFIFANGAGEGEGRESHARDEGGESAGEESGTEYSPTDRFDSIRKGVRLVLEYDAGRNEFVGFVENTMSETARQVRVEIHLSNGTELGPTRSVDLKPGEIRNVIMKATDAPFDGWTPHAESGSGEGGGEHGGQGESGSD